MTNNQQNQTGYPSIDKPWMKYYKKFDDDFINETAYDCLRRNCNNPKGNAISFYGNNISYESLFEHIASTRAAIVKFGVKKGDVVCVCLPNIPEAIYIFYALNSLGAIANYLDVRLNPQEFHEELTISRSNLLFLFDDCVPGYLEKINKISTLKKAVSISVSESLPFNKKIIYNLSKMKSSAKNSKLINWNNFIEKSISKKDEFIKYDGSLPAAIIHTGGTTGVPKGVLLSNNNLNAMVANYEKIGMNITPGQVFLNLIPPFLAYGLVNSMHMPLCMGMSEVIIPPMNPMDFYKQVKQYKPAHVLATVVHYECLMNAAKENDDFSFFLDPGAGGDVLLESMETRINNFLKLHGCNHKLAKGYGMTEMSSCAITVTNDDYNVSGSVGIPLPLNNIAIINPENGKEVEYDQVGEICMTGPTLMLKYVNNEQETNNAIYYDAKGIRWIHTGDLGHITKDGIVFVDGRIKRMIVKAGGFKIYPAKIEEIIMQNEAIEYGAVLGVSMENQGAVPVAYVKLKMGYQFEDVKTKLLKQLAGSLPDYAIPAEIISIENMPFTKSNKINYKKLEEHYFTHH